MNVKDIIRYYDHQVYLKDPRDPSLTRDLPGFRVAPRFYVDDPKAEDLGAMAELNKPGLAIKHQVGWNSVYSAAPIVPAMLLRVLAKEAGCHIYDDGGDVVVANASFLSIYSPAGGDRTIRLPKAMSVFDLLKGKTVAEKVSEFPLKLNANESVLFKIEPSAVAANSSAVDNEKLFRSYRAQHDAELTADPDSEFWKGISGVTIDKSVLGPEVPELKAEVRSRWTDKSIYFLFSGHYESLAVNAHPDLQHETPHLWEKDVFEVYLGSDSAAPQSLPRVSTFAAGRVSR